MTVKVFLLTLSISCLLVYDVHAMKTRTIVSFLALTAVHADSQNRTRVFDACTDLTSACQNGIPSEDEALQQLYNAIQTTPDIDEENEKGESGLYVLGKYLGVIGSNKCNALPKAIDQLLTAGANAKIRFNDDPVPMQNSLLHLSVKYGHPTLISPLVEAGIDVNVINIWNTTPLHWATYAGWCEYERDVPELTIQLLSLGANPNAQDWTGATPLHWANTRISITQLIKNGANKEATQHSVNGSLILTGRTPLLKAAGIAHDISVETLLAYGANKSAHDRDGFTAQQLAQDNLDHPYDGINYERAIQVMKLLNGTSLVTPLPEICANTSLAQS